MYSWFHVCFIILHTIEGECIALQRFMQIPRHLSLSTPFNAIVFLWGNNTKHEIKSAYWNCRSLNYSKNYLLPNRVWRNLQGDYPSMPFAWSLLTLVLFGYCLIGHTTNRVLLHHDYLIQNRTGIKARRGSYTPFVWNTKPDESIRECNQLCKLVSRSLHGWRVVFWFVWVLWQAVLFKTAHVEEHKGSGVESSDQREGAVQCAHPVLQSSCCDDSLQG